ncbi:sortase [Candidatus Microgenomates bacterium]|nr:sortase [Candidatus Microgenomates bacterium]
MTYQGIIYDSRLSPAYGEIVITIDAPFRSPLLRKLGLSLMVAGFAGVFLTTAPVIKQEVGYRLANAITPANIEGVSGMGELAVRAQAEASQEDKEKEYAKQMAAQFGITDTKFFLYIPKIEAKAPIVANVNPGAEATFKEALKRGIAHAEGTSYPDQEGSSYLFAHSTDSPLNFAQYNAVFYLLHTIKPEDNDEIYLFYNDKLYKYKITEKHIVDAGDTSWLVNQVSQKRLVLQTCWPPGTSWKRLIIVATPVEG